MNRPGAVALRATDGIDHGAHGAFAVCAGDVNDLAASIRMAACAPQTFQAELVEQTLDIFQARA